MTAVNVTHHMTIDGLELISVADLGDGRELRCSTRWRDATEAADHVPGARAAFEARAACTDATSEVSCTQIRRVRTPWGHLGVLTVRGSDRLTIPTVGRVAGGVRATWRGRALIVSKL